MREPKDIKIGNYTLEEILERHLHWLNRDCENWESMRADLHNANMSYANMRCVDLSGADLHNANMSYANMRCVDLSGANMRGADMSYANMRYTDLHDANMSGANMRGADMSYANMRCANMSYANMSYANMIESNLTDTNMIESNLRYSIMSYADLSCTNLCGADISGADICGANMRGANMRGANMMGANMMCANMMGANLCDADRLRKGIKLSEPIIGWKKCKNNVLVKLEIPRGAIVFSINNKKCRTDKAKVLEIIGADRAYSNHKFFSYYVGDIIEVFNFNCEYNVECAEGIHFFRTREEAENY